MYLYQYLYQYHTPKLSFAHATFSLFLIESAVHTRSGQTIEPTTKQLNQPNNTTRNSPVNINHQPTYRSFHFSATLARQGPAEPISLSQMYHRPVASDSLLISLISSPTYDLMITPLSRPATTALRIITELHRADRETRPRETNRIPYIRPELINDN